jgi:hypothetical protein
VKCFYTKLDDNTYNCICTAKIIQKKNTGYSNLRSHVLNQHKNYEEEIFASQKQLKLGFCVSDKAKNLYYWMKTVIMSNFPFSYVENSYVREGSRYSPICTDTLMKYLLATEKAVVRKIREMIPTKFGIIFDGWSSGTVHYVAVYAVFPENGNRTQILLAMQPLYDETSQSAAAHADYINGVLESYGRSANDLYFICGDNCNTNKKIARELKVQFIGCHSHIFNLAVESYLDANFKEVLAKIEKLSGKLRNRKAAGKLRSLGCNLEAISRNVTRWSSAFAMIKRYKEIKRFVNAANFPDLVECIPTPVEEGQVENALAIMEKLQSITLALQRNDLKLAEARLLFEGASTLISGQDDYLGDTARILDSPIFLSAIVKIQNNEASLLTAEESKLVSEFKIESSARVDVESESQFDFATEILLARKKPKVADQYVNLDWIPPTSNVVERLFSLTRLTFTDYRKATLPENLECTLFLKVNSSFWGIETVGKIVSETPIEIS